MESKTFSTAAVVSLTSGVLLCDFGKMHELAEYVMGHPVWTHEFASKSMWNLMKSKLLEQHPGLPVEANGEQPWQDFLAAACVKFGETLVITKGEEVRPADPMLRSKLATVSNQRDNFRQLASDLIHWHGVIAYSDFDAHEAAQAKLVERYKDLTK